MQHVPWVAVGLFMLLSSGCGRRDGPLDVADRGPIVADGGPIDDPCDGISIQHLGQPVVFKTPTQYLQDGGSFDCAATSDQRGRMAFATFLAGTINGSKVADGTIVWIAEPDGTVVASDDFAVPPNMAGASGFLGPDPGPEGFVGFAPADGGGVFPDTLLLMPDDGSAVASVALPGIALSFAPRPAGGEVVLAQWIMMQPPDQATVSAFDERGAQAWQVTFQGPLGRGIVGVDSMGNALVLFPTTPPPALQTWEGFWVTPSGSAGIPFTASAGALDLRLAARIGGGFFLAAFDGTAYRWAAELNPGNAGTDAVPTWLAGRSGGMLFQVRGGRAYALLPMASPPTGAASCAVELVLPSGQSCGTTIVSTGSRACGLTMGPDGTLIQRLPDSANCDASNRCACSWQYWPSALR